nr:hypothetical protein [uncultured Flavobacterium sp.]
MKKLLNIPQIFYCLSFFIAIISILSCTNQEKENIDSIYKMDYIKEDPSINFSTIDCLNESNQKAIELSGISLRLYTDLNILKKLLKIKRDNKKINSDFNKLTKENLIIIPKLFYHLDINDDSLVNKKPELYVLKKLEIEIKNQITSLDSIEKYNQNNDFKTFARNSKKILKKNNDVLQTLLSK